MVNKKEREYAIDLQKVLLKELKHNREILSEWTPYHAELYEKSFQIASSNSDSISEFQINKIVDYENRGILRDAYIDNAWQLFNQNHIKIDIDLRLAISRIYEQQQYVQNSLDNLLKFLEERETIRDELAHENYIMFTRLIAELWGQESAMLNSIDEVIYDLEESLSK